MEDCYSEGLVFERVSGTFPFVDLKIFIPYVCVFGGWKNVIVFSL